jgi:flagellar biosynthesis/type III secretory pathway M-ring protein FliF/YscJ
MTYYQIGAQAFKQVFSLSLLMNKSYIFAITLVLLIGIQLYQPTSAQSPSTTSTSNGASNELENASDVTKDAAIELENATSELTDITKSLQQNISTATASTKVNATTIVNSIFESYLPALFIIVIFLVIIIPLVFDMYIVYKRSPRGRTAKGEDKPRQGMPGLYRSLMCFGVILLVGTVIFYLLALITLNINNTQTPVVQSLIDLLKNLGTILGTALATIIAFYFGIRGAESAFTTGAQSKEEETESKKEETEPTEGEGKKDKEQDVIDD